MNNEEIDQTNIWLTWSLSTDGYYFRYRLDVFDNSIIRATLFNKKNRQVDDVRVSEGYGLPAKSHTDVINYFEARLTLKQIT